MMPVPASPRAVMRSFMAESMLRSMRGMGFPGPGLPMPGADLRLEIESRLAEPRLGREPGPAFEVPGYEDVERAALALDAVQRALDGRSPKKVIVVPQRIVNVVG